MKTIEEWLREIPDPEIAALALKRRKEQGDYNRGGMTASIMSAVNNAFNWDETHEGGYYWKSVRRAASYGEPIPHPPQLTHKGVGEGDEGLYFLEPSFTAGGDLAHAIEACKATLPQATPHLKTILPDDAKLRKQFPLATGCMEYFPNAMLAVSHQSWLGNQQHHPDKPLHWDRQKSADESDAGARHSVEGDLVAKAWRALAELERALLKGYKPWSYLNTPEDGN